MERSDQPLLFLHQSTMVETTVKNSLLTWHIPIQKGHRGAFALLKIRMTLFNNYKPRIILLVVSRRILANWMPPIRWTRCDGARELNFNAEFR